jgi:hypothetical protein
VRPETQEVRSVHVAAGGVEGGGVVPLQRDVLGAHTRAPLVSDAQQVPPHWLSLEQVRAQVGVPLLLTHSCPLAHVAQPPDGGIVGVVPPGHTRSGLRVRPRPKVNDAQTPPPPSL